MTAAGVVRAFWTAMQGNDWARVADRHLAEDYEGIWPQTGEVLSGRHDFVRVNAGFPGQGGWRFELVELTAEQDRVVTDTRVTQADLGITARAITFHQVAGGLIRRQREFWPDPADVPTWRRGMLPRDPVRARF